MYDPNCKETPDLPGEIYDDHAVCAYCHEVIPLHEIQYSSTIDDDVLCGRCAEYLDAMAQNLWEAQREDEATQGPTKTL